MWAYAQVGVHLLHYTGYQWQEGWHVPTSQVRPGDLVFFAYDVNDPATIHHVGMYIGNGEMINAPFTGSVVSIAYAFGPGFIGAVRPYAG
jgi:cell wall-associated NlpC family hydrolase